MSNKFAESAKSKSNAPRTECIPYITSDDTGIQYGWFTQEEFQKTGYKRVELGNFVNQLGDNND